jgi:choline dehydrogenase-like flavoprotein
VVPHIFENGNPSVDLTALVQQRIASAPTAIARDLERSVDALGSRFPGFVIAGRLTPFASMTAEDRARAFEMWGVSAIPLARSVFQALRRLILSTWYCTPQGRVEAGLLPPLHTRSPAWPWEGPLAGTPDEREPVARLSPSDARAKLRAQVATPLPRSVSSSEELRGEVTRTADVVIVGSGAGGSVAAARLAQSGLEVVILEQGEYLHAPDFNEIESDMLPRLFADRALRATVDGSILLLQGGAAGGGTTVNWMLMFRTPDHVLEEWEREHELTGFTKRDLTPVFEKIEDETHARVVPDDAHAPSNRIILDGARTLGWRVQPAVINAAGCIRAGTCSLGCRYDAKRSALLTYLPRAFASGARLFANASVERVDVLERDTGRTGGSPPLKRVQATIRDPGTGRIHARLSIDAPIVILAAGAVGTPVILERSGLGGGGVGRFLRLHPTTAVMGRYDREMYPFAGIPQSAYSDEFIRRDANGHGFWIECPALQPALAAIALGTFGAAHRADMQSLPRTAALIALIRDGSGVDGSQGSVWIDRRGACRIRYRMSAADRGNLVESVVACARLHLAAGAKEVVSLHTPPVRLADDAGVAALRAADYAPNRMALFSAHLNGTCRMGVHPATSGTTPEGERHGVRGLYVCDGSLLPTSLGVNPQETIMAVASLVAGRIAQART